jgi:ribosome maturation factor RimP
MVDIQDIARAVEELLAAKAEDERGEVATAENGSARIDGGGTATEIGGAAAENAGTTAGNADAGLFLVEAKLLAGDAVEVFIDSDARGGDGRLRGVTVEDCVALTRAIEARFDRDVDDFSLTVSSAGIGQPLRVMRQYLKLIGRSVEVVLAGGTKLTGVLGAVGRNDGGEGIEGVGITLSYPEKRKAEGKKKPEIVTVTETFPLSEIKTTKEYIDFK